MDEEERVECPLGLTKEEKRRLLLRVAKAARKEQEKVREKAKEIRERVKKTKILFREMAQGDTLSLRGSLLQVCVGEVREATLRVAQDG